MVDCYENKTQLKTKQNSRLNLHMHLKLCIRYNNWNLWHLIFKKNNSTASLNKIILGNWSAIEYIVSLNHYFNLNKKNMNLEGDI